MSFGGFGGSLGGSGGGDKSLSLPLTQIFKLAWEDDDLRARIKFVLLMFAVFALGIHVPVPIPGLNEADVMEKLKNSYVFQMIDSFGGGALRRLSIFALGMNPYITASIIMQILSSAFPQLKKELEEGGEYARKKQNQRTRLLTLVMCAVQGWGYIQLLQSGINGSLGLGTILTVLIFWTAGSMFTLWLGEQISEKGIGNGVSLMIFAGIMIALPYQGNKLMTGLKDGAVHVTQVAILLIIFLASTWLVVHFTSAQRRIPVQHMRRMIGTKAVGGKTSYLPFSLLMAGVIPIIFASAIIYMPAQFGQMLGGDKAVNPNPLGAALMSLGNFISPAPNKPIFGINWAINPIGCIIYLLMILFFSYFWNAIQYNVEDISNNLKRAGSIIPGVRPGKQTKDFLDDVISKLTIVGAVFIAAIALLQYITPAATHLSYQYGVGAVGGTSLLILVSVALETMRQIEANLLMKQYDQ